MNAQEKERIKEIMIDGQMPPLATVELVLGRKVASGEYYTCKKELLNLTTLGDIVSKYLSAVCK